MQTRLAKPGDAEAVARVYTQGIEDRSATFETRLRTPADIVPWFDGSHPIIVVEQDGIVVAFAATSNYRPRQCYAGIAEVSVYVDRAFRRRGAGRIALQRLLRAASEAGYWKLVSRIFPENTPSLGLVRALGFREVGIYRNHGRLDGVWRDVVIVERLIEENLR